MSDVSAVSLLYYVHILYVLVDELLRQREFGWPFSLRTALTFVVSMYIPLLGVLLPTVGKISIIAF